MFKFLTNRPFWVNLLFAIVLAFLLLFLGLQTLGWITNHGAHLTVPAVVGKKTGDAIKLLESKGFEVEITDSVYTDSAKNGIVLKQIPDPNSTVKINRKVLLIVNRLVAPMLDMPKLEGLSMNFALDVLERNHLKIQDTLFKPDFAKGSVLDVQYNGNKILPGARIQWGSAITLIIGSGLEDRQMLVPDLVGMTFREAKVIMEENSLSLGAIITEEKLADSSSSFVVKQNPSRFDEDKLPHYIKSGQLMDLWLSKANVPISDSIPNTPIRKSKKDE